MRQLYTIICGQGFDRGGNPIADPQDKRAIVRRLLAGEFGGVTETACEGGWIDNEGKLVRERSVKWEIIVQGDQDIAVMATTQHIRDIFRQNCVALTKTRLEWAELI